MCISFVFNSCTSLLSKNILITKISQFTVSSSSNTEYLSANKLPWQRMGVSYRSRLCLVLMATLIHLLPSTCPTLQLLLLLPPLLAPLVTAHISRPMVLVFLLHCLHGNRLHPLSHLKVKDGSSLWCMVVFLPLLQGPLPLLFPPEPQGLLVFPHHLPLSKTG